MNRSTARGAPLAASAAESLLSPEGVRAVDTSPASRPDAAPALPPVPDTSEVRGPDQVADVADFRPLRMLGAWVVSLLTVNIVVSVFFGPDELSLVKGSPDARRRFLDDLVVKLRPARYALRRELDRVLKQRNALLKTAPRGPSEGRIAATLEVWDEALCDAGAAVVAARLEALGSMAGLPRAALHSQLAAALSVIIHLVRRRGHRRIAEIHVLEREDRTGLVGTVPALSWAPDGFRREAGWPRLERLL
jgi:hypothetical protein